VPANGGKSGNLNKDSRAVVLPGEKTKKENRQAAARLGPASESRGQMGGGRGGSDLKEGKRRGKNEAFSSRRSAWRSRIRGEEGGLARIAWCHRLKKKGKEEREGPLRKGESSFCNRRPQLPGGKEK